MDSVQRFGQYVADSGLCLHIPLSAILPAEAAVRYPPETAFRSNNNKYLIIIKIVLNNGRCRTLSVILICPGNQGIRPVNQQLAKSVRGPATCGYTTVIPGMTELLQLGRPDLVIFNDNYKANAAWVAMCYHIQKRGN